MLRLAFELEKQYMPQVDIDRAVQFVHASKDPILSALALYAAGTMGTGEVLDTLKACQRADGGWTKTDKDFQGDLSAISTTWVALQWLLWIGAGDSGALEKTVTFLRNTQRADGAWDEPEEIRQYDPPSWMLPGRYENQLWLTSAVCCKLKELGREQDVDFARAIDFLRRGWDGTRFPMFVHPHWMAMPLFYMQYTGSDADQQIIKGCKRFLYEAIVSGQVDPGDFISIAYASLLAEGIAGDLHETALKAVYRNQLDDGGWKTDYGDKHRPGFTVEALFLLTRTGL
jgi:hypothetical protein